MAVITPTITAYDTKEYKHQIDLVAHFAERIHIDLTDGIFTKEKTVSYEQAWWPVGLKVDLHLMFKNPIEAVKKLIEHKPNLVIVHSEADGEFEKVAELCHKNQVAVGVALLQQTPAETILPGMKDIDHVLIFSGNLGYQGGSVADMELLDKVNLLKKHKPHLEIGWDGGVNDQNVAELALSGVDVLNVGGFLQTAAEPAETYRVLSRIADETGST